MVIVIMRRLRTLQRRTAGARAQSRASVRGPAATISARSGEKSSYGTKCVKRFPPPARHHLRVCGDASAPPNDRCRGDPDPATRRHGLRSLVSEASPGTGPAAPALRARRSSRWNRGRRPATARYPAGLDAGCAVPELGHDLALMRPGNLCEWGLASAQRDLVGADLQLSELGFSLPVRLGDPGRCANFFRLPETRPRDLNRLVASTTVEPLRSASRNARSSPPPGASGGTPLSLNYLGRECELPARGSPNVFLNSSGSARW
jgi:hypothetical protein